MLATCSVLPALSGCLLSESPDYGEARQTAPVIDPLTIVPSPLYQLTVDYVTGQQISFQVRSEDAGEDLKAALYVDYRVPSPREKFIDDFDIAHRPFDQPKNVQLPFAPTRRDFEPGCHTLTALVMHRSSFDDNLSNRPIDARVVDDLAMVTWWFVATDANSPAAPEPCPGGADVP